MNFLLVSALLMNAAPASDAVTPANAEPAVEAKHAEEAKVPFVTLSSLNLMLQKGLITQADYDSTVAQMQDSLGAQAGEAPTLILGRFSTTLYGFLEADNIFDTTQSFNDQAANANIARPGTYASTHPRYTMAVRNSRFGFRMRAPEWHSIRASAMVEMDFFGNQPTTVSEAQFFINPTLRVRHYNLKLETPVFDVLIGQYWDLFGWQSDYHPNTVEIQGVTGQIYSRTPQIRFSKTVKSDAVTFEAAIAAMRPPQRDSAAPEGQAGLRLAFNHVTAVRTAGATGTQVAPLSIAITGDVRHYLVNPYVGQQQSTQLTGYGGAVDIFVPIVPGHSKKDGNSFALNAEAAYSTGDADLYSSLSGGVAAPTPAAPATYTANIDNGLVGYRGGAVKAFQTVQWTSVLAGLQYYLPDCDGRMWLSANVAHIESDNARYMGAAAKTVRWETWADGNLFIDATPAVRFGLEYAYFLEQYTDGAQAENHRIQLSAFYIF